MLIVHVFVRVRPECAEDFKAASRKNAESSIKEPGIVRFDVIQQEDDPARFVLVEVYRRHEDTLKHKETGHYHQWRDTVESMMAEPRYSIRFAPVFPDEKGWG